MSSSKVYVEQGGRASKLAAFVETLSPDERKLFDEAVNGARSSARKALELYRPSAKKASKGSTTNEIGLLLTMCLKELSYMDKIMPEMSFMSDLTYMHFMAELVNAYGKPEFYKVALQFSDGNVAAADLLMNDIDAIREVPATTAN